MFFTTFKDRQKRFRWNLKAGNGRIIGKSAQPHMTEESAFNALRAAELLMGAYANFDVYKDKKGEWRWRCVRFSATKNGADTILADSAESYTRKGNAQRMVAKINKALENGILCVKGRG